MKLVVLRSPLAGVTCLGFAASLLVACGSDGTSGASRDGGSGGGSGSVGSLGGGSSGGASSGGKDGNGGATAGSTGNGGARAGGASNGGGGSGPADAGASAGGASRGGASGGTRSAGGASSGGTSSGGGASTGGTSSGGASSGGAGGGGTALVNPAPGSKFFVGANFWNIDWEGQGDFFQSNVDWTKTTNPWQPALLTDLAPYHVLRFMDWNQTNDSNNPQAVWDTRKQKTQDQSEPVAFEWQIDLCNRTKKDYWLNVPHEANADYWTKLATLVKSQLEPSLRVYLEYSNEVWNGGFPQNGYAADKAKSLNLAGSVPAASYYVYASVRLYEAFEGVFGKGSPQLVKVLAGQAAWTGPCDAQMLALADTTINPKGTMPTVYAIAPYFSGKTTSELSSSLPTVNQWTTDSNKCANGKKLPLVSYEGGSDSFSASNCTTVQHDPGMHDLYTSYLDGISGAGLKGPFMQYTHTGACWGLKEKTTDSLDASPKYKGVLDWLAAHP